MSSSLCADLRANADLTEKALAFMADSEQIEESKADIALWRAAADEIERNGSVKWGDLSSSMAERERAELAERMFGLALLGFPVEQAADYVGLSVEAVRSERARCRQMAHNAIADALSAEVFGG